MPKRKVTKADRFMQDFLEYNKRQKRFGLDEITLKQYVAKRAGKSRYKPRVVSSPLDAKSLRRETPKVESGAGIGSAIPKKSENKYTGDKLMGIATMHKSNMVPVFKQEDAEDIAKMRRN
jgi:hypothetical protein